MFGDLRGLVGRLASRELNKGKVLELMHDFCGLKKGDCFRSVGRRGIYVIFRNSNGRPMMFPSTLFREAQE